LDINAGYAEAHFNLGIALLQQGRLDEALAQYQQALQNKPGYADAHVNLGLALLQKRRVDEAVSHYREALRINPNHAPARVNLANALARAGKRDEAITQYQQALQITPNDEVALVNLGIVLLQSDRAGEAGACFQKALQLNPADAKANNNLAWLMATSPEASLRDGGRAVELARQANALTGGNNPMMLHTLAAALAEAGRFSEALDTAQRALQMAAAQSNSRLAGQLKIEMELYQAGRPFRTTDQAH
jgi:tetratricopeptide (TPR) repeat protein